MVQRSKQLRFFQKPLLYVKKSDKVMRVGWTVVPFLWQPSEKSSFMATGRESLMSEPK